LKKKSEMIKIKVEPNCEDKKYVESENCIKDNIKQEPEVEFVLILPPRQVKIEIEEENKTQTNENLYRCRQCPKSFKIQKNLKSHERSHAAKVNCQICNKKLRRDCLKIHLKLHEDVKEFNCDHCSAGFVTMLSFHFINHLNFCEAFV
jgi:uncharacterized Zn-finger protein